MDKERFINFLKKHILTIFPGSEIVNEEESTPRDALVAMGSGGTLLVKFHKTDLYRIVIKKIQPFKAFEINLIRSIISELLKVYNSAEFAPMYFNELQKHIVEKSICKSMNEVSYKTILNIVSELTKWSNRTYEGKRTLFGFLISNHKAPKNINPNHHISKILLENFAAVIAEGKRTCLKISSDGYLLGFVTIPQGKDANINVPYDYINMASLCTGNKVGVCLTENGDILILHQKSLVFAKKYGSWVRYGHEEILDRISNQTNEITELNRKALYLSALDVSFARTGGCVVHLNKEEENNVLKIIDKSDILLESYYNIKQKQTPITTPENQTEESDEENTENLSYADFLKNEKCVKIANLQAVIGGKKFYELDRKLRQELISIDGATIITNDGEILAVGAIIIINSGGFSGGRLAASKTLAHYGVSLKISADGEILGFKNTSNKQKTTPIFMLS